MTLDVRQAGFSAQWPMLHRPSQIAVRTRKADGEWSEAVLVSNLSLEALSQLVSTPSPLWAVVYAYDLRGGGIEPQNRNDKQGLGLTKRNKASFAAQEILVLLAHLAHNLTLWTRNHLAKTDPAFQQFGIQRLVRRCAANPRTSSHRSLRPYRSDYSESFASFCSDLRPGFLILFGAG